ncbi:hypothetical protein ACFFMN_38210 [Planobispora siamensis]|uniref:Metallo-peptidase family M12B Reprolysin-like n=1 Tax=Planobispora siamensis TaxID=936338 RepID=A0A8J3WPU8_9ACTN|nr:hypothetical protein [Planobispora siamensis]GIH97325.1 hypothetical protein Psi01_79550 [Planobispora siamensis]
MAEGRTVPAASHEPRRRGVLGRGPADRPVRSVLAAGLLAVGLLTPAHAAVAAAPPRGPVAAPAGEAVTGTVRAVVAEGREGEPGEITQLLDTGEDLLPLAGEPLPPSAEVTVEVTQAPSGDYQVTEVLDVAPAEVSTPPVAQHRVYVAFVNPAGTTAADPAPSLSQVTDRIAETDDFWSDQTGGKVRFSLAATVPEYSSSYTCDQPFELWDEARSKFGGLGWGLPDGSHVLLILPGTAADRGCSHGLGTIGDNYASGGYAYVAAAGPRTEVFAHEFGHNLSLEHSDSLSCDTRQDSTFHDDGVLPDDPECARLAYGDFIDVMGIDDGSLGNLNAVQLDHLGLSPEAFTTVPRETTSTVTVPPLSAGLAGRPAVRIPVDEGVSYYLQYRTRAGRDSTASQFYHYGVQVYRGRPPGGPYGTRASLLLDPTPEVNNYVNRSSLPQGATFSSAEGDVTVRVLSQDAGGATVEVVNAASATPPPPVSAGELTIAGPASAVRGAQVTYSTVVTGTDGNPFADQLVELTADYGDGGGPVPVGAGVTDEFGRTQVTIVATRPMGVRWRTAGGADEAAVSSGVRYLQVTAPPASARPTAVRIAAPASKVQQRQAFTVSAVVTDQRGKALPRWSVLLQKQVGGTSRWVTVATRTTGGTGAVAYRTSILKPTYYRWVTVARAGAPSRVSAPKLVRTR